MQDNKGNPLQRTMGKAKDVTELLKTIAEGRGVKKEKIVLSCDGGCDPPKLLVMGTILDLENPDPEGLKPWGVHRMILLGMVDDIPENNANLTIMLRELGFPMLRQDVQFVGDIKIVEIVIGLHGPQSTHACPYGECYRVKQKTDKKTGKTEWVKVGSGGRWVKRVDRTLRRCREWNRRWRNSGGKPLADFMGCQYDPLNIFSDEYQDTPLIVLFPPMPLHLILGRYMSPKLFGCESSPISRNVRTIVRQLVSKCKVRLSTAK